METMITPYGRNRYIHTQGDSRAMQYLVFSFESGDDPNMMLSHMSFFKTKKMLKLLQKIKTRLETADRIWTSVSARTIISQIFRVKAAENQVFWISNSKTM